jgi:sugar lactone lactonase YvrE
MKKYLFSLCILLISFSQKAQNFVSTYAGNGTPGLVNGDTITARFNTPFGMCIDKFENIYIADAGNNCIRKISATGSVTTLAGTGVAGFADGPAASAQFNSPTGVYADDLGNVYVADFLNHRIRKISNTGSVTTIAGTGVAGYADGLPASAQFNYPRGIVRNKKGDLFVGDSWNHRIRKIPATGTVSTYAGGGAAMGVGSVGSLLNANDTAARFYTPAGLSIDRTGNIFVADAYNHRIRRIDTFRVVTTVAGSGPIGNGNGGYANGPIANALLNTPTELFVDSTGKIYIGDTFNNRVRQVSAGNVITYAGKGIQGYLDDQDTLARFNYTRGVVCNATGTKVYVADYNNSCIRKIQFGTFVGEEKKINSSFELTLSPNPASAFLSLQISETDEAISLKIIDVLGRELKNTAYNSQIDISDLPIGIYTLLVSSKNFRGSKQFVKN